MKKKLRQLNMVVMLLLILTFGAGCGKQKVVELPVEVGTAVEASTTTGVETATEVESSAEVTTAVEEAPGADNVNTSTATESEDTGSENAIISAEVTTDSRTVSDDLEVHTDAGSAAIDEDGIYDSKEDVAEYLHEFGKLPQNFITKKEAKALGWTGGSVEEYAPGKCIGGDRFGNYEGLLPEADGRRYFECDIDTLGKSKRGPKRIIYSNDGLIFYTEDHYESYEQLY